MNAAEPLSVVVERELAHPPEKIWRALTQPHLMEVWLMKTDFAPVVGQGFTLHAGWGDIACQVLELEPGRALAYSWAAKGLDSVVTWTLTPTDRGTRLRMEQVGFQPDQPFAHRGATAGWPRFFDALEQALAGAD